ncbi:MAG TPA: hypothetical protein VLA78_13720 [Paracoccaceae bacterium]|jgi:hypothetical protein|nr:hypothetical protein [Paracoccaceae bacterium]
MRAALIPLLLLAACAALPSPQPQAARLSADTLTVTLTDGTACRADWRAGAGRLADCGPGYDWQVEEVRDPNLLRQLAEGVLGALAAEGALAPMAAVTLTDAQGRVFRFASPPPAD